MHLVGMTVLPQIALIDLLIANILRLYFHFLYHYLCPALCLSLLVFLTLVLSVILLAYG